MAMLTSPSLEAARAHQRSLLDTAQRERLARVALATAERPAESMLNRSLAGLGGWLAERGAALEARYGARVIRSAPSSAEAAPCG